MEKNEDTHMSAPDTEHLASQVVVPKKSHKTLYVVIAVVVLVIAAAAAGLYLYKVKVLDPKAAEAASAAASSSPQPQTQEEKMTAILTDGVQKQLDAIKQNDDSKYIKDASAAASTVGENLHEQDLHD